MPETERFVLTEEHVKLLRAAYVGWDEDEWGAPEIDPKRPFGNGDHLRDMYRILTGDPLWSDEHDLPRGMSGDEWRERQVEYRRLYRDLRTALQVVLAAGSFEPGAYETPRYYRDWRRVEEGVMANG